MIPNARRNTAAAGAGLTLLVAAAWLIAGTGHPAGSGARTSFAAESRPLETLRPASEVPGSAASASLASSPTPSLATPPRIGRFPGGLLIADRLNGRLLVVDDSGSVLWAFPVADSLLAGETFSADDAFVAPDGKTIVANEEANQVVVRIDIATKKVVWEYGTFGVHGSGLNQLWSPDDAYPMANGDITLADIKNCRILEIAPDKQIVRQLGVAGTCDHSPPTTFSDPNGDTPLPDGGMLVTEITGSRVVRLSATGEVLFDVAVPVSYPSDAQLTPDGNVLVVDYANPGALVVFDPRTQQVVYRYGPTSGPGQLVHPSLALPLPDGTYVTTDDRRDRVVVVDPTTNTIVWSYGHADQASAADGYLNYPDGIDVVPVGVFR
jgi:outer membrane protein assembly factor BamB